MSENKRKTRGIICRQLQITQAPRLGKQNPVQGWEAVNRDALESPARAFTAQLETGSNADSQRNSYERLVIVCQVRNNNLTTIFSTTRYWWCLLGDCWRHTAGTLPNQPSHPFIKEPEPFVTVSFEMVGGTYVRKEANQTQSRRSQCLKSQRNLRDVWEHRASGLYA